MSQQDVSPNTRSGGGPAAPAAPAALERLARACAFAVDAAAVLVATRRGRRWRVCAARGLPARWDGEVPAAWLRPWSDAARRRPLAVEDAAGTPWADEPLLRDAGSRAALAAVARSPAGEAALLVALSVDARAWTAEEREAVDDLAATAAATLEPDESEAERRRLREQLRMLRTAVETMQLGVTVTDPGGRIVYVNPAEAAMHGYAVEDLLGRHARVLAPPALWDEGGRAAAGLRSWTRESVNARRDGSDFPVILWSDRVVDEEGEVVALVTCCQDATAVRAAEDALRAEEERFRQLAEHIDAVLYVNDGSDVARTTYVSPAYDRIWGRSRESLFAEPRSWTDALHPEDRERVHAALSAQESEGYDVEYRITRPDGELRWIHDRSFAIRDREGRIYRYAGIAEDVTARRAAEEALRVSEKRYRELFEGIPVGVYRTSPDGRLLDANTALAHTLGFASREELLSADLDELVVDPEDRREWRRRIDRDGVVRDFEIRNRRKDGRVIWLRDSARAVRGPDGEVLHYDGSLKDVTERHEAEEALRRARDELETRVRERTAELDAANRRLTAEVEERSRSREALRESEERFRTVVENLGEALLLTDLDDRVLYANPLVREVTGYEPAEMVGRVAHELLLPGPEKEVLLEAMRRRGEGVSDRYQVRITRKDGNRAWIEVIGTPLLDPAGRVVGTLGAITDITERLRGEQELRAIQERFRLVVETVRDYAIVTLDLQGFVLSWNAGAERITGYTVEEILGRELSVFYPPDEVAAGVPAAAMRRALEEGRAEQEGWRVRKDGTVFWAHTVLNSLLDDAGSRIGFAAITRDLTRARETEDALRRSEEQLRHSQKMEAVGRLAGGIAHDFNNILMAMGGNVQLLLRHTPRDDPRRTELDEVKKGADRAAALTQQLLAFSRRQVLQPRVVDLNEVVGGMLGMMERLVSEDVEIVARFVADPGRVRADPGQLEQVVMNLVVNSRDAMPDGGVILLETRAVEVGPEGIAGHRDVPPGAYVALSVTDTGMGMDAATRERVFEPFFTTKEEGKGTGLGLSTVYGIVQQSGGFITVASKPGVTTTFRVWLPAAGEPATPRPAVAAEAPARGSETILLVEDEDAVRRVVRMALAGYGYRVLEAGRPSEALRHLELHDGPIDLLLTDVVMPGSSGVELSRRFLALRPGARVLFLSGYAPDEAVQREVARGRAGFLQKPVLPDTVVRRVQEMLDAGGGR